MVCHEQAHMLWRSQFIYVYDSKPSVDRKSAAEVSDGHTWAAVQVTLPAGRWKCASTRREGAKAEKLRLMDFNIRELG